MSPTTSYKTHRGFTGARRYSAWGQTLPDLEFTVPISIWAFTHLPGSIYLWAAQTCQYVSEFCIHGTLLAFFATCFLYSLSVVGLRSIRAHSWSSNSIRPVLLRGTFWFYPNVALQTKSQRPVNIHISWCTQGRDPGLRWGMASNSLLLTTLQRQRGEWDRGARDLPCLRGRNILPQERRHPA